ncbi:MAG: hypothetical protein AMXMBFR82_49870 [Candidatus Hydrogenedentota bacterium]
MRMLIVPSPRRPRLCLVVDMLRALTAILVLAGVTASAQDLSLTLSDSVDPVIAGNLLVYTISLTHNGGVDATNVAVTQFDPTNTTLVNFSVLTGAGWSTAVIPDPGGGFGVQFSKGTVTAAETASFSVTVQVGSATPDGTILTGTASVVADQADTNPGDENPSEQTTVGTAANLVLSGLNGTPDPVDAGNNITYSYTVTNNAGPSSAQAVTVTQPVPANTTFVSASLITGAGWGISAPSVGATGTVQFSKAAVARNEGAVFEVVVQVDLAASGNIMSTVTAASTTTEASPGNESGSETVAVNAIPPSIPVIAVPRFEVVH